MARIPLSIQVAPTFQGVEMPQGAFRATGQAVAGVIGAVGGAVDTVKQFVDEAQNIRNQQDVRDTVREMRTMQAQFQEELVANNIDPANWTSEWEKRLATFEGDLRGRNFPPVVANSTQSQFKDFAGQSLIAVSANALKENRRRAIGSWELDYNNALENGQTDEARRLKQEAVDANLLDPVQQKAVDYEIANKDKALDLQTAMELDPEDLIKRLKDGTYPDKFDPITKSKIIDDAERALAQNEKRAVLELKQGLEMGAFETKEKFAEELEKYPELSESTKKFMLFNYGNLKPVESGEKQAILDPLRDAAKAFARGELTLQQYGAIHDRTQSAVYSLGDRAGAGALKSALHNYDPANMAGGEADAVREAMKKKFEGGREIGVDLINEYAKGAENAVVAKKRDQNTNEGITAGAEDIANLRAGEAQYGVLFRSAMEDVLDSYLAQPHEKQPTAAEIKTHLEREMPNVVEKLERDLKEAQKTPVVPKATPVVEETPAGSAPTTLPLPNENTPPRVRIPEGQEKDPTRPTLPTEAQSRMQNWLDEDLPSLLPPLR